MPASSRARRASISSWTASQPFLGQQTAPDDGLVRDDDGGVAGSAEPRDGSGSSGDEVDVRRARQVVDERDERAVPVEENGRLHARAPEEAGCVGIGGGERVVVADVAVVAVEGMPFIRPTKRGITSKPKSKTSMSAISRQASALTT